MRANQCFRCVTCFVLIAVCSAFLIDSNALVASEGLLRAWQQARGQHQKRAQLAKEIVASRNSALPALTAQLRDSSLKPRDIASLLEFMARIDTPEAFSLLRTQIAQYAEHPQKSRCALMALAQMTLPDASAYLLAYSAPNALLAQGHVFALQSHVSLESRLRLVEYLQHENMLVSSRARHALVSCNWETMAYADKRQIQSHLLKIPDKDEVPAHVLYNALWVCHSAQQPGWCVEMLEECLKTNTEAACSASVRFLQLHTGCLKESKVQVALETVLLPGVADTHATCLLTIIRKEKPEGGVDLCLLALEHTSKRVRVAATSALEAITGKHLGRNPQVWRTAFENGEIE